MNHWHNIRAQARAQHAAALSAELRLRPASEIVEKVAAAAGLTLVPVPANEPYLCGASAVLVDDEIFYNNELSYGFKLYCQAHELAHHFLHQGQTHCDLQSLETSVSDAADPHGEARVTGYGPHELREREANLFARELLLPSDKLRHAFLIKDLTARDIATLTSVPLLLVQHQLAHALLVATPQQTASSGQQAASGGKQTASSGQQAAFADVAPASEATVTATTERVTPTASRPLDDSQWAAATVAHGPLLVEAGPGTGKTTTLVRRVLHLLETDTPPESILCLTFSNKAAQEMRQRVAKVAPEAAERIWLGTFHAFGLELLRQYWCEAGLSPTPALLDPIDAIFLLEQALPELELDYYQNLAQPTRFLGHILGAISRAKDELASPARYLQLAQQMQHEAEAVGAADEVVKAAKALEVARVYAIYERLLREKGWLDFGDLIYRTVNLLQTNEAVCSAVRGRFRAVLVDEYQDVNRASGVLLKLLAGDGAGLWAVGDVRQSIFRWRGASTANMRLFTTDFAGGKVWPLEVNYRSQPPIVTTFSTLAPQMKATRTEAYNDTSAQINGISAQANSASAHTNGTSSHANFTAWTPHRPHTGGQVSYDVAATWPEEARRLADAIQQHHAAGHAYREQAIICRTHTQLNRVAAALEQANIPLFYLGDLFTRPEIRDLLTLLRLSWTNQGRCLVRVGQMAEYRLPLMAVRRVLKVAAERGLAFPAALRVAQEFSESEGFDHALKTRFVLLAQHLAGLEEAATPWDFLATYLFDRSHYVHEMLRDDSPAGRQKCLAVYQLLQFAWTQRGATFFTETAPRHALLRYVRRLAMHGAGRDYAPVPEWAEGLDAVRLLTVHAAKGLEFPIVYLPHLGQRHFPATRQASNCPPPVGLVAGAKDAQSEHEEEEECLFFVALSRARDYLSLSCARSYGKTASNPSMLLELLAGAIPSPVIPSAPRAAKASRADALPVDSNTAPLRCSASQLDKYLSCPRRYYYENVLGLSRQREEMAYEQFTTCVYDTLRWLQAERAQHRADSVAQTLAQLAVVWEEKGPTTHPYADLYYRTAKQLVGQALMYLAGCEGQLTQPAWEIALTNGNVWVRPGLVETAADGKTVTVHRFRTGRPPRSVPEEAVFGLYLQGLQQQVGDAVAKAVRLVYLKTGTVQEIKLSPRQVKNRLTKYDEALAGIRRQEFDAVPNALVCPECPHYFVCGHQVHR